MRFLHIADLHIGKQLNDVSMLEDQQYILEEIAEIARTEQVQAVLIAGDVYQQSAPSADAMEVFDAFLTRMTQMGMQVFIISGNHDSAQRIAYFGELLERSGVYVSPVFEGEMRRVTLTDEFGTLNVYLLPFLKPVQVRRWLPEADTGSYQSAVQAVINAANVDLGERNVILCHQFIVGAEGDGSEELMVGGLDAIDARVLDGFDYAALGHIHRAQKLSRDTLRYAGSPLKYSFSEASHKKSVTVIDMGVKGDVSVRTVPLKPMRELRTVTGTQAEIMQLPYSEDYVWVTVTDELVAPDARVTISTVFPNMLKFTVSNSRTRYDVDVSAAEDLEQKGIAELFGDFYRYQNGDVEPTEAHYRVLESILSELEEDTDETR